MNALPHTPQSELAAFATSLPARGALIGIDLGSKTVGLALSDNERSIAGPYGTLERRRFAQDWAQIERILQREGIAGFVIGLPLNMDGSSGTRVQASRTYARSIRNICSLPLLFWDERLSTFEAGHMLDLTPMRHKKKAAAIDAAAAAIILQDALDALRAQSRHAPRARSTRREPDQGTRIRPPPAGSRTSRP